jgi:carboxymethylenebutenolidase
VTGPTPVEGPAVESCDRADWREVLVTQTTESTWLNRNDPDPLSPLNQMQRYLVHEFVEDYQDGLLSRRDLMAKVSYIAGGAAAGAAILTHFGVSTAEVSAQEGTPPPPTEPQSPISVPEDDPAIVATEITFPSGEVTYTAYEARPTGELASPEAGAGASPVAAVPALILICHENRGLTDHIRDVARRFARAGYVGCALDLLSPEGGTASVADPSSIPGILTEGDMNRHVAAFQNAIVHYRDAGDPAAERVGMTGYCLGGGITWRTATAEPALLAAAPFYGPPPPLDQVPNIRAAVLGVYSDDPDDFANEGRDELVAALEAAGVIFQIEVYPETQHAFHNDTGQRYNEEQALAAWNDTLAWFETYVRG